MIVERFNGSRVRALRPNTTACSDWPRSFSREALALSASGLLGASFRVRAMASSNAFSYWGPPIRMLCTRAIIALAIQTSGDSGSSCTALSIAPCATRPASPMSIDRPCWASTIVAWA